jgi:hypothetical protein
VTTLDRARDEVITGVTTREGGESMTLETDTDIAEAEEGVLRRPLPRGPAGPFNVHRLFLSTTVFRSIAAVQVPVRMGVEHGRVTFDMDPDLVEDRVKRTLANGHLHRRVDQQLARLYRLAEHERFRDHASLHRWLRAFWPHP